MKIYKFYTDRDIKDFWQDYWERVKEDNDYIIDYNHYPFIPLKKYLKKSDKVLEIGCGTGRVLKGLYNEGYNIMGFDFDFNSLQSVNLRNAYPVFLADIINMPLKENIFDVVLCYGVVTCIEDQKSIGRIFDSVKKILKKDGVFIVSLLNYNMLRKIQKQILLCKTRSKKNRFFYCWAASQSALRAFLGKYFVIIEKIPSKTREPLWHYAPFLRSSKPINEKMARVNDKQYTLNLLGEILFKAVNLICPFSISGSTIFVCRNIKNE